MTPFLAEAQELAEELVAIRRDLHMHSELGFQEVRTAGIVAEQLSALGYEVVTGGGKTGDVTGTRGVDPTVNAPAPTALVYDVASDVFGKDNVDSMYRTTGGEDFSAVLARVPGNFFFLGARNEARGITAPHHNPHFDIDETCLPQGVAVLCEAAVQALGEFGGGNLLAS